MFFVFEEFLSQFSKKVEPVAHNEKFDQVDEHSESYQEEESPTERVSVIVISHEVCEANEEIEVD
jgi:hypothetical protein